MFRGVDDLTKGNTSSLLPTCYSLAGDGSVRRKGMKTIHVPTHLREQRKDLFAELGAPDLEHPEAERWDGNSTRQRI